VKLRTVANRFEFKEQGCLDQQIGCVRFGALRVKFVFFLTWRLFQLGSPNCISEGNQVCVREGEIFQDQYLFDVLLTVYHYVSQ
jgi:hypothetical protein